MELVRNEKNSRCGIGVFLERSRAGCTIHVSLKKIKDNTIKNLICSVVHFLDTALDDHSA